MVKKQNKQNKGGDRYSREAKGYKPEVISNLPENVECYKINYKLNNIKHVKNTCFYKDTEKIYKEK